MKTLADCSLEDFGIDPDDLVGNNVSLDRVMLVYDYEQPVFQGDSVIEELFEELDFEQEVRENYERKSNT